MNWGIGVLQTRALPLGYGAVLNVSRNSLCEISTGVLDGADDEARTRYLHLGKVALYQMSYIRILNWRPGTGSNRRPLA